MPGRGNKNHKATVSKEAVRKSTKEREVSLWLDDVRVAPEGWTWVKSVPEAQALLKDESVVVKIASLDNDLGLDAQGQPLAEGRSLVLWMCERAADGSGVWPSQGIRVHSSNVVAVEYMTGLIKRYSPFSRTPDPRVFKLK